MKPLSVTALRRFLVSHQGYATRARNATPAQIAAEIRRLSCVQLDSISRVERAHRITLGSRLGRFEPAAISRLLGEGKLFEYWAHEACLLSIEDYPLFRRRMEHLKKRHWWGRVHKHDPKVKARVLGALREQGPLPARFFEGGGGKGMWQWKPEKRILEDLFAAGEVIVSGREGFQRVYALPEAAIPREVLEAPMPSEDEFVRAYVLRAVEGRGALTLAGIAEHCRFRNEVRKRLPKAMKSLLAEGALRQVPVADEGPDVFVTADAQLEDVRPFSASALLSPFDNLLWDRAFMVRVFDFLPLIEVYKRGPQRKYGYYVLPFLHGDRLVGRADLGAKREVGTLEVLALHFEPGVRVTGALQSSFDAAAARLARAIDLKEGVVRR